MGRPSPSRGCFRSPTTFARVRRRANGRPYRHNAGAQEIEVELADGTSADELAEKVEKAVAAASGMLWLTESVVAGVGVLP